MLNIQLQRITASFLIVAATGMVGIFLVARWDYRTSANILWMLGVPGVLAFLVGKTNLQRASLFVVLFALLVLSGYAFAIAVWGDYN